MYTGFLFQNCSFGEKSSFGNSQQAFQFQHGLVLEKCVLRPSHLGARVFTLIFQCDFLNFGTVLVPCRHRSRV